MYKAPDREPTIQNDIRRAIIINLKVALFLTLFTWLIAWFAGDLDLGLALRIFLGWSVLAVIIGISRGRRGEI